jgi:LytS/YehU family sensor histidine kinase
VWTLLFSLALAVPFTVLGFVLFAGPASAWRNVSGWLYWYGQNLVVSLIIAAIIHLLFDASRVLLAGRKPVGEWQGWQRTLFFMTVPLCGLAIGWPLALTLLGYDVGRLLNSGANAVAGGVLLGLVISGVMHVVFGAKSRQLDAERRASEAQLRLLQAQMEPHFLFNTLANVHSLIDHEPATAKQMLGAFTDYLRASLTDLRRDAVPLQDELALAQAYLRVQQIRMQDRLSFTIDADAATQALRLPPLLLQPLVENAVLHGLEPKLEGGAVHISAQVQGQSLVITVQDNGLGLNPGHKPQRATAGVALENLRSRLLARYADTGRLVLAAAADGAGTQATLKLPLEAGA